MIVILKLIWDKSIIQPLSYLYILSWYLLFYLICRWGLSVHRPQLRHQMHPIL